MEYNKLISLDLSDVGSLKKVYLKQYENKYTTLKFANLDIKEGYDYFAVYRQEGKKTTYEIPMTGNELTLGTYITNYEGCYMLSIIAHHDEEDIVIIKAPIKIVVEKGVLTDEIEDVKFPEPLQSKYEQLIALIEEVEGKLERGEFKGDTGNGIASATFSDYKLTLHFTDGTSYTTPSIRGEKGDKGDKGDAYIITERDYEAIADIATERAESKFNQYYDGKVEAFDTNATNKTNAFNTNATAKTTEFDTHATEKADEEIARINADDIVARIDEKADKSDTYTKEEVDEKVAQATPTDYEQVKEDIALLKWKTLNLATEIVDSTEAYSKSVPSNVYENALLNKLGGKTEVANQLTNVANNSYSTNGISGYSQNGQVVLSGTATANARIYYNDKPIEFKQGHKYYLKGCASGGSSSTYRIWTESSIAFPASNRIYDYGDGAIKEALGNETLNPSNSYIQVFNNATLNNTIFKPRLVDLTQRYGEGNEPTSVDDPRIKLLDQELELNGEYNEGSLVSAEVQRIVSRGANIWNEEWEVGGINASTGENYFETNVLRTKGFIPIEPNTTYFAYNGYESTNVRTRYYDSDKNYIGYDGWLWNTAHQVPSNAYYLRFYTQATYGDTYRNDIAIIKGTSGTYSPYWETTKPIASIIQKYFPQEMKSAQSVYDYFDLERGLAIQCVGVINLNNYDWAIYQREQNPFFYYSSDDFLPYVDANSYISTYSYMNGILISANKQFRVSITNGTILGDIPKPIGLINLPLKTPIETPIAQEDLEYLEALKVESNGTITFEQLSTYIQIPNEESYLKRVE